MRGRLADDLGDAANVRRERRDGAVAADETDIVAEWQQLVDDRLDQRSVIAAGNVAASDRSAEQYIADMRETHFLAVEHHAAG